MILETNDFLKDLLRWKKMFIYEKKTLQRAKNTLEQYERILEKFYEYSIEHEDYMKISSINKQYLLNFLIWKEESSNEENSANSKHAYITVLKSFLKYISDNNEAETNLLKKIKDIKITLPKRQPKGLNTEEVALLLSYLEELLDKEPRTLNGKIINYRNSLVIKLMLYGGLRVSEVLSVKLTNVELYQDEEIYKITVIGKGDKERNTYIEEKKISTEINFLKSKNIEYVAQTRSGKVMDRRNTHRMLTEVYKNSHIKDKTGVHILRHTFAQSLVNDNINLSTIQELLGHSNIQTTMIYARSNENTKIKAIKRIN
jgi:integrase/recombinase XerD